MSKTTKRKHVTREVLEEFVLPTDDQEIVKVVAGRGNNLHEVENPAGEKFLASMPSKFRKNVWIKRGDFVIVDPISEGSKVKAEISVILYPEQIKYIKEEGKWPEVFFPKKEEREEDAKEASVKELIGEMEENLTVDSDNCSETDSDNDDDLFVNTNRPVITCYYTDESTTEEEEEDEEEAEGVREEKLEVENHVT